MKRVLPLLIAGLLLASSFTAASAIDTSGSTLESDLASGIAKNLVDTYAQQTAAPPSFDAFEQLYASFETVEKWRAFLDATKLAKLPETGAQVVSVRAAMELLTQGGIDSAGIARAAIAKLDGVTDWSSANATQGALVIDQLNALLGQIKEPVQQIEGQMLLARVELDAGNNDAARTNAAAALHGLAEVPDAATRLDHARKLVDLTVHRNDKTMIETLSTIVASLADTDGRATLTDEIAARLASNARVTAAADNDPLALAWAFHVGGKTDVTDVLAKVGHGIDPLPAIVVLASGIDSTDAQAQCGALVDDLVANGATMRALNLRKALPVADCPPSTDLVLADAFAAHGLQTLGSSLLDGYVKDIEQGYKPAAAEIAKLTVTLGRLGTDEPFTAHANVLQATLGDGFAIARGRAAIEAILDANKAGRAGALTASTDPAAGYPAAGAMLDLLSGKAPRAAWFAADDLALLTRIGASLEDGHATETLPDVLGGDLDIKARLALAEGITGERSFRPDDSGPLTNALRTLAGDSHDLLLSAALGDIDTTTLAPETADFDDILRRAARASAWTGDLSRAASIAKRATAPDLIEADIAGIEAITGDFDAGMTAMRAVADPMIRAAAFRFVAEQRVDLLDTQNWFGNGAAPQQPAPAEIVKASVPFNFSTAGLELSTNSARQPVTPPLPDLDVSSLEVTGGIPYPTGGEGGMVVGGEGRYVRLARFESPSFDGDENNGVRDYVYQQNKTITPEFIFLNHGVFTLADLIAAVGRDQTDVVEDLGEGIVRINRPVAIGPDATLILSGQEVREVQLNSTLGAYLVNAGKLYIAGTRLVGYDTDADAPAYIAKGEPSDHFRPFILGWSGSKTYAADSQFVAMGYSAGRSYGFSLTSGPDDDYFRRAGAPAPTGIVVNNSFENLYYGFYAFEADGAQVVGNEYRDSVIYGIDPHDRSRHLNLSLNATYGSAKKHGIIISREVDDSFIIGNLSFENHGSGIMLDRNSVGTVIAGNTLHANEGDGMAVFESPCTLVAMNEISNNKRSGILVRNSWDVAVTGNHIADNHAAGVVGFISDLSVADGSQGRNLKVDPYQPFATVSIDRNTIVANGTGIQTAGVSSAEIYGNTFLHQSRRLFSGDLAGMESALLQSSKRTPALVATTCRPVLAPRKACPLASIGAVLPASDQLYTTAAEGDYCTGGGTPQAQAFGGGL